MLKARLVLTFHRAQLIYTCPKELLKLGTNAYKFFVKLQKGPLDQASSNLPCNVSSEQFKELVSRVGGRTFVAGGEHAAKNDFVGGEHELVAATDHLSYFKFQIYSNL